MCLRTISKRYKPKECKKRFGWKEFRVSGGDLTSRFSDWGIGVLPIGKFLNENKYRKDRAKLKIINYGENGIEYDLGWHVGLNKANINLNKGNSEYVVRRVEFKEAHTLGIDETYCTSTIVAKYMKILE